MTNSSVVLTLYSRTYCHLCDDMLNALAPLKRLYSFEVQVEDVDADPAWEALYDEKVPVLVADGNELCHYFLDEGRVRAFLEEKQAIKK